MNTVALGASALAFRLRLGAAPARPPVPKLTMLNGMAGSDFEVCCRRHVELGLKWLDLKDSLWGQTINNLSLENARRAADLAGEHGLGVACFSTALCSSYLAEGEETFRTRHLRTLDHVLKLAEILRPERIRLIAAMLKPFPADGQAMAVVEREYAWVFNVYRDLIDRMVAAGQRVLLENETPDSIFNQPEGVVRFFRVLDRAEKVRYTWDVQNLWQMGVFPTMDVYRTLRPLIGCIHLKGGRADAEGGPLVHASALEDASWPVAEIMRAAVADGVAPVICLNPSHGKQPPGWNLWETTRRDVAFLRRTLGADL
ncbi:MAG: TIM barrel protein [Opitutaceae bacterium]|nr:TIM barrel protein [Opitutaceae bacterium]